MNIISVIPLSRSRTLGELSYFTASEIPVGAIVNVPIRSKNIHAIVVKVRAVSDMKSEIKEASFQMKKLGKVKATAFFPASFMRSCSTLADYYTTTIGSIVEKLTADVLIENSIKIEIPGESSASSSKRETYAVQGDDVDRISSWRSLIRQEFARKKSIALYVPTIEDAKNIFRSIEKGIDGYLFMLHGDMSDKKILETWQSIAKTDHPVVIIATGSFTLLPRTDIESVIIERENGRGWVSQRAPYIDLRHAIETIARERGQTIYIADNLLRTETLHRVDGGQITEGTPFKWRSITTAKTALVDMKRMQEMTRGNGQGESVIEKQENSPQKNKFSVLSPELEKMILENREENSHLFIYCVRRGMSPTTVCDDCQTIVSCINCSAPVVLHASKQSGRNFFMCHKCGERRSADELCAHCGGARLTPLGIGIDRVEEEIKARFPIVDVFKIDADSTKTEKQIQAVLAKFRAKPGSILIGTEMALLHLPEKLEHIAVASIDSLFGLPDFRIQEKIMYTLIRLRNIASRNFLVQTRRPSEKVLEYGLKGNLSDFYRTTLDERMQFSYPPYSLLIKLTIEGKKDAIAEEMAAFVKILEPQEVDIFPAFTSTVRGNSVIHGLIKVPPRTWPNPELADKLKNLPPNVSVKVNPESLL